MLGRMLLQCGKMQEEVECNEGTGGSDQYVNSRCPISFTVIMRRRESPLRCRQCNFPPCEWRGHLWSVSEAEQHSEEYLMRRPPQSGHGRWYWTLPWVHRNRVVLPECILRYTKRSSRAESQQRRNNTQEGRAAADGRQILLCLAPNCDVAYIEHIHLRYPSSRSRSRLPREFEDDVAFWIDPEVTVQTCVGGRTPRFVLNALGHRTRQQQKQQQRYLRTKFSVPTHTCQERFGC